MGAIRVTSSPPRDCHLTTVQSAPSLLLAHAQTLQTSVETSTHHGKATSKKCTGLVFGPLHLYTLARVTSLDMYKPSAWPFDAVGYALKPQWIRIAVGSPSPPRCLTELLPTSRDEGTCPPSPATNGAQMALTAETPYV